MKTGSEILKELLQREGINSNQLASKMKLNRTQPIYDILNGKIKKISDNYADKILDEYPDYNKVWLLTGEGEMLKSNSNNETLDINAGLPLVPFEYIAGYGEDNQGIKLDECTRYIIPEFENVGAEFLVRVGGSSMYPKYSSGDILACKKIHEITFFQWGKIYVIDSAQGQMIKRVCEHEDDEKIWLISDNKDKLSNDKEKYAPFAIRKDDIRSLSIVLGVVRME